MMKYTLLYSLLGIGLLAGCSNEGTPSSDSETEHISFNITLDDVPATPITRTVSDMKFDIYGFRIAGYHTVGQFSGSGTAPTPNVFDKEPGLGAVPLVKKGTAGRYELPLAKLVLQDGTFLSFFAWAQNKTPDTTSGVIASTNSSSQQGAPFLDIRVDDAPALQTDIVVSRFMNHHNSYVLSAVDLKFGHALSKLTFKARSSTGCKINFTKVNVIYTGSKVYRRAKFTFAATPGPATSDVDSLLGAYSDFSEYHSGAHALTTTYPTIAGNNIVSLGDMTLIPQNTTDGFCSLELTYDLATEAGVIEKSVTKIVPLKAIDLLRGKNYIYTLDITADKIELSHGLIAQWTDDVSLSGLPLIAGPRGDVLLLLDGSDPPYEHTNGKKYWLDRSGYNRHCEMKIPDVVTHNSKAKAYDINTGIAASAFSVPSLGTQTAMTVDIIASGDPSDDAHSQTAFRFSDSGTHRNFQTHIVWKQSGVVFFDAGHVGDSDIPNVDYSRVQFGLGAGTAKQLLMYTYKYQDNGYQSITCNGNVQYVEKTALSGKILGELSTNVLGEHYKGTIKYLKVMRGVKNYQTTKDEFAVLEKKYGVATIPTNYVSDGLMLDLQGRSGSASGQWRDQSGQSNHAQIYGSVSRHNGGFSFPGDMKSYMKLIKTLGTNQLFTVEFVASSNLGIETTLFLFSTVGSNADRIFHMHYPMVQTIYIDAPGDGHLPVSRLVLPNNDLSYSIVKTNQWSISRNPDIANGLKAWENRVKQQENSSTSTLTEMKHCYIGTSTSRSFTGVVYAVRFYNRVLTDNERYHNYLFDKKLYNELP